MEWEMADGSKNGQAFLVGDRFGVDRNGSGIASGCSRRALMFIGEVKEELEGKR